MRQMPVKEKHKVAEARLTNSCVRESEERFRKLAEGSFDMHFVTDREGYITYVSPAAERIFYFKPEKMVGKHFMDFLAESERVRVSKEFANKVQSKEPGVITMKIIRKDSSHGFVELGFSSIVESGTVVGMQGVIRDITEHKQAEEALRESEEKYRRVVENIGIGVSLISPKMEILALNRQLRESFPDIDVSKKPICYKSFNNPPGENICSYCPTYKSLKDGQVHESITKTPTGDKIVNWRIISSPIKDKDGKVIAAIEMTEEITERKKAEDALRESKERYKALFEGAAEGIIVADTETTEFKYVNPAICKMLGYTEEELGRLGVRDIHPKEDLEHVVSEFEAQARGEKTLSSSIPCLRKDGTIMYADINTAMVLIDGRQCNVGFFTDITERKRIKAELENYKEKILQAQKHAYISSMGAIVAHQLNQPLTMINMLLAKALELGQAKDNCCLPVLKKIKNSLTEAKKAALIIRKFHQYSRDPALETTGKLNVSSTVNRIISMLSERAEQAKINISAKTLDDLPRVEINETALEQIFLIIIQNAIEAADGRKQHRLTISGQTTDKEIKLQFSDDCCGITTENLDKIFEPFFSTKSNDKGLGLGLEIVQQILIGHGGQIDVESQIDKGTTFYVTLPVKN